MNDDIKYITLGQAAKLTGRSKSAIFKAIKNGTLSFAEKTTAGYKLDPEEVLMVFPANDKGREHGVRSQTFDVSTETTENSLLKLEIKFLREQLEREREQADCWRLHATNLSTQISIAQDKKTESLLLKKLFGNR